MFEPPNIPSMPGPLPNKKCCSQDAIHQWMDGVEYQIDRMMNGQTPYSKAVAATISPTQCNNGMCSNEPVDPKSYVFKKGYSKDPCVKLLHQPSRVHSLHRYEAMGQELDEQPNPSFSGVPRVRRRESLPDAIRRKVSGAHPMVRRFGDGVHSVSCLSAVERFPSVISTGRT